MAAPLLAIAGGISAAGSLGKLIGSALDDGYHPDPTHIRAAGTSGLPGSSYKTGEDAAGRIGGVVNVHLGEAEEARRQAAYRQMQALQALQMRAQGVNPQLQQYQQQQMAKAQQGLLQAGASQRGGYNPFAAQEWQRRASGVQQASAAGNTLARQQDQQEALGQYGQGLGEQYASLMKAFSGYGDQEALRRMQQMTAEEARLRALLGQGLQDWKAKYGTEGGFQTGRST